MIYSGKLLSDTSVLKDVLRQYDGQEAHTVHLVFTPKLNSKKFYENQKSTNSNHMNSEGLRHRTNSSVNNLTDTHSNNSNSSNDNQQLLLNNQNVAETSTLNSQTIPNNIFNMNNYYASLNSANTSSGAGNPNDHLLAQQFAMQAWMQQTYSQYLNQYMNV